VSTGLDVVQCVSAAASVSVTAGGAAVSCTGSDGTAGTLAVVHLDLSGGATQAAFDYSQAGDLWGVAFCSVVGLYVVSRGIGAVVDFIRRA
jgi:hypothetical protein